MKRGRPPKSYTFAIRPPAIAPETSWWCVRDREEFTRALAKNTERMLKNDARLPRQKAEGNA